MLTGPDEGVYPARVPKAGGASAYFSFLRTVYCADSFPERRGRGWRMPKGESTTA